MSALESLIETHMRHMGFDSENRETGPYSAYTKFDDNAYARFKTDGAVVHENVLPPEYARYLFEDLAWQMAEWTDRLPVPVDIKGDYCGLDQLRPHHSMLIQNYAVGHLQAVWDVRQDPRVVDVFAELWSRIMGETKTAWDFVTSFDGISIHLPPEETEDEDAWFKKTWLHVDQRLDDSRLKCVQGMVTLQDVRSEDATFCYIRGSHLYHEEFAKVFAADFEGPKKQKKLKKDWYSFTKKQQEWYLSRPGAELVRVSAKAGSVILWDSRTVHCGVEPLKDREEPEGGPPTRAVVYTCYLPVETPIGSITDAQRRKRVDNFLNRRTTSHWPYPPRVFPKEANRRGMPPPIPESMFDLPTPKLTELGLWLVDSSMGDYEPGTDFWSDKAATTDDVVTDNGAPKKTKKMRVKSSPASAE